MKNALNLIKKYEGCRLTSYKCPAGVWTIGYGHTGAVDGSAIISGMRITKAKAIELLEKDVEKFAGYVDSKEFVPVKLNSNQRDALISFAFNTGAGNLKTLCKGRTVEQIGEKIILYNKASGKTLNGLVKRRREEQKLFRKSVLPNCIKNTSKKENVKWMQERLNRVNCGLPKLVVDGKWGKKTKAYVLAVWKAWGWKQSSGRGIGKSTIARLAALK